MKPKNNITTKLLLLFIIIFLFGINAKAQDSLLVLQKNKIKEYKKFISSGNIFYHNMNYQKAEELFNKAYNIADNSFALNYKLGVCYLNTQQVNKSIEYLKKAYKINNSDTTSIAFILASAYHDAYKFNEASSFYQKHLSICDSTEKLFILKKIEE